MWPTSTSRSTSCRGSSSSSARRSTSTPSKACRSSVLSAARWTPVLAHLQARDRRRFRRPQLCLALAPLFAYIAWRIKRDSARSRLLPPGPARAEHARVHDPEVQDDEGRHGSGASIARYIQRRCPSRRQHQRERSLQARAPGRDHAVRPLAAKDEPRRAPAADQRPARRHVARRPAAVHPLRDGALRSRTTSSASSFRPGSPASGRSRPGRIRPSARRSTWTSPTPVAGRSVSTCACSAGRRSQFCDERAAT